MRLYPLTTPERLRAAEHRADPRGDFATFENARRVGNRILIDGIDYASVSDNAFETSVFGPSPYHPSQSLVDNLKRNAEGGRNRESDRRHVLRGLFAYQRRHVYRDRILEHGHLYVPERVIALCQELKHLSDVSFTAYVGHVFTVRGVPVGVVEQGARTQLRTSFGPVATYAVCDIVSRNWCDQLDILIERAQDWIDGNQDLSFVTPGRMRKFARLVVHKEILETLHERILEQDTYPMAESNPYRLVRRELRLWDAMQDERIRAFVTDIDGVHLNHPFGLDTVTEMRLPELRALVESPLSFDDLTLDFDGTLYTRKDDRQIPFAHLYPVRGETYLAFETHIETVPMPSALEPDSAEYMACLKSKLESIHHEWCDRVLYDLSVHQAGDPVAATALVDALDISLNWVD